MSYVQLAHPSRTVKDVLADLSFCPSLSGKLTLHGWSLGLTAQRFNLAAFGFLPGKEVKEAGIGNLGLQDRE